jgi:hypothetical protein
VGKERKGCIFGQTRVLRNATSGQIPRQGVAGEWRQGVAYDPDDSSPVIGDKVSPMINA